MSSADVMGLTLPLGDAVFRFATRDTAGSWTADTIFDGGVNNRPKNFVSVACDELRITANYNATYTFNRVYFHALSVVAGLNFTVSAGIGSTTQVYDDVQTLQPVARPLPVVNEIIRFADTPADTVEIIITGIGQAQLDIMQFIVGVTAWLPIEGFSWGSGEDPADRSALLATRSANYLTIEDSTTSIELILQGLTDEEAKSLKHFLRYQCAGGYCLFEPALNNDLDCFLAVIPPSRIDWQNVNYNNTQLTIYGAYE